MGQFGGIRPPDLVEAATQVVLDRFNVVAGDRLLFGELVDVCLPETGDDRAQSPFLFVGERMHAEDAAIGQRHQPFHLHVHPGAVEAGL